MRTTTMPLILPIRPLNNVGKLFLVFLYIKTQKIKWTKINNAFCFNECIPLQVEFRVYLSSREPEAFAASPN